MYNRLKEYLNDDLFKLTILDNKIHVINYKKIIVLEENKISLLTNNNKIIIKGNNLVLKKLLDKEI